jgi:hypothetical protein
MRIIRLHPPLRTIDITIHAGIMRRLLPLLLPLLLLRLSSQDVMQ